VLPPGGGIGPSAAGSPPQGARGYAKRRFGLARGSIRLALNPLREKHLWLEIDGGGIRWPPCARNCSWSPAKSSVLSRRCAVLSQNRWKLVRMRKSLAGRIG